MNNFLDRIWLDNPVRNYLIALIVILFIVVVKRYVARYIAMFIFQFVKRIWNDIERKSFITLVARPLGFFLAVFISVIALYKLKFPSVLDGDIYHLTVKELCHGIGSFVIVLAFIRLLLRMIDFLSIILTIRADKTPDMTDNQMVIFFKDFFRVVIIIVGLLMVLKFVFGYRLSNLLTGLSIVGAAIALALRESLENLIASFIIFFDKPFKVGDAVKVQAFSGSVEKIGLRSTRIRTDQKTLITVPNKQMVDSILDNISLMTHRKGDLKLEINLGTSPAALNELIGKIKKLLTANEIVSSTVFLSDITSSAYLVTVEYLTEPVTLAQFQSIRQETNFKILGLLEEMKIEIAGASKDIRIVKQAD